MKNLYRSLCAFIFLIQMIPELSYSQSDKSINNNLQYSIEKKQSKDFSESVIREWINSHNADKGNRFEESVRNAGDKNSEGYYDVKTGASGFSSNTGRSYLSESFMSTPLAGDYLVGLNLFNSITGRNITFTRIVRKVLKEVYEPSIETDISDKSKVQDPVSLTASPLRKVLKEAEEVILIPMENGSRYNGPLFASKENYPLIPGDASGGVYATITAAITDLNTRGISDSVRFLLADPNYTSATESYPLIINAIAGSSEINKVTIRPNTGISSVISGISANGIFKFNGADYITIDGSNSEGTDRNISIIDSSSTGIVIWNASASASDGAVFNTIKNCNIRGLSQFTTFAGIFSGGGTSFGSEAGFPNSNLTIQNNEITKVQNAVYLRGNSVSYDTAMTVRGNILGTALSNLGFRGIFIGNSRHFSIYENEISGIISSPSSTATMQGIQVGNNIDGGDIFKNKIYKVKQTNTTIGWGAAGILLGTATITSNVSVYNNFISEVTGYGYPAASSIDNGNGIMLENGGGYNLYFNTVSMNINQTRTDGIPSALNISSAVVTSNSLNVRNNIFSNTQTVGTNRYCVYSGAAASVYSEINYNDYYFASNPNLGFLGGNQAAITNWRTATGDDQSSISGDPKFVSNTDLHIDSNVISPCNAAGVSLEGIMEDIDGNIRDGFNPDIGADEFDILINDVGVTEIIYPNEGNNTLLPDPVAPKATIKNFGDINQTAYFNITCTINPGGYSSTISDTISAGLQRDVTFAGNFEPSSDTLYTVIVYTSLEGDMENSNDTLMHTSYFIDVKPVITSFSPESGPVGTAVIITGSGFNSIPSGNIVFFGAVKAEVTSADTDSLNVIVPAGANYEYVTVTNLDSNLTGYSLKPFIVTFPGGCKADFAPYVSFAGGSNVMDVITGDMDSDGKPDLISANRSSNSVSVYRNISDSGNVSFEPKVDFATLSGAQDICLGDMDGDGKLDIAVSNNGNASVSLFRNISDSGNINFDSRVDVTTPLVSYGVSINDIDGDGKPDLASACEFCLSVYRNTSSSGSFSFEQDTVYYNLAARPFIRFGDIDTDNKTDIVLTDESKSFSDVQIFRNTSAYGEIRFEIIDYPTAYSHRQFAIGDLDGDGKSDLSFQNNVLTGMPYFSALRNTSASGIISFEDSVNFNAGTNYQFSISMGDIDGDSRPDAVFGSSGVVSILRNNSLPGTVSFSEPFVYTGLTDLLSVNIGDLNGDGKPEIVTANGNSDALTVYKNLAVPAQLNTLASGNGNPIENGSVTPDTSNHTDFGEISTDTSEIRTYTFRNTSTDSLVVGSISISGGDSAMFVPDSLTLSEKIAPGDSVMFSITFSPASEGVKTSTVKITSGINSGTECFIGQTYTFAVKGTGNNSGIINITLIQEGFYNAGTDQLRISDTVKTYLHSGVSPFEVIDSALALVDSLSFTGSFIFTNAPSGTYYIKIRHRNTVETWSKPGGEVYAPGTTMSYDFTSAASQALGENQKQVAIFGKSNVSGKDNTGRDAATVRFGIYSGDVNQDGIIEATDFSLIDNDAFKSVTGYVVTDLNGDAIVDGNDALIVDNNSANFISAVIP